MEALDFSFVFDKDGNFISGKYNLNLQIGVMIYPESRQCIVEFKYTDREYLRTFVITLDELKKIVRKAEETKNVVLESWQKQRRQDD